MTMRTPHWLAITLWDFSWVTYSGPGEPFADLDRAFAEAVARGYNTVRICAMPLLMFDPQGQPRPSLTMVPWPGPLGKGTRWYTQRHATTVHPADWLTRFFTSARQHGCQVIVSSWEYQQTLSFLADRQLAEEVLSVPPTERFDRLATGFDHLLRFLRQQDLLETVAYVELHNEVNASFLREIGGDDPLVTMRPYLERALRFLQERHPDVLFTAGYTNLPPYRADILPENLQVMHQHIYEYGHLRELYRQAGLYDGRYPTDVARSLWQPGAPEFADYQFPPEEGWRERATGVRRALVHLHDVCDGEKFDAWLYAHWQEYRQAILNGIRLKLEAYAYVAKRRGIPAVIGEGWLGYTPLRSRFETEAAGKEIIRQAVQWAKELGYWGVVLCSNYAPHHPEWVDADWQRRLNDALVGA